MLAWLIDKVRWLLLIAAVGGPVAAYFAWSDAQRIREVETKGVETTALIENATRTKRRRGGTSYALDLAWKDAKGTVLKAEKVTISTALANQIIKDDKIVRGAVRIKYIRDAADVAPVVTEDVNRQEEQDDFMMQAGIGAGAVGIVGSALFFLVGRRRRSEAAAS